MKLVFRIILLSMKYKTGYWLISFVISSLLSMFWLISLFAFPISDINLVFCCIITTKQNWTNANFSCSMCRIRKGRWWRADKSCIQTLGQILSSRWFVFIPWLVKNKNFKKLEIWCLYSTIIDVTKFSAISIFQLWLFQSSNKGSTFSKLSWIETLCTIVAFWFSFFQLSICLLI